MKSVWEEMLYAARQAPRMFFAPFVGAVRGTRSVMRQIDLENHKRAAGQARHRLNNAD